MKGKRGQKGPNARGASQGRGAAVAAEQASQLEATFDALADGLLVFDADGKLQRMNTAARTLLMVEGPLTNYALPDAPNASSRFSVRDARGEEMAQAQWPIRRILRGEVLTGRSAEDVIIRALDGTEHQLSVSGAPVRGPGGRIVGAVCIMHDVTERRALERRTNEALGALLQLAEALVVMPVAEAPSTEDLPPTATSAIAWRLAELTRRILGCERAGIVGLDAETGRLRPLAVVGLTPEQERMWPQTSAQVSGMRLADELGTERVARLRDGDVLALDLSLPPFTGWPYALETALLAPMLVRERLTGVLGLSYGGTEHLHTAEEFALAGAAGQLVALVMEHERLLAEREEAAANELALRQANARMDEFLGMASHEIRNPLATIKTNIQLALRRLGSVNGTDTAALEHTVEGIRPLLGKADQQVNRLTRLVNDLLDVSRIQANKLEMRPEPADLAALVCTAVDDVRGMEQGHEITLEAPAVRVPVVADADRIGQVVVNYLTNALKFSPADRPVEVALRVEGERACVSVRDQGPGLPPEEHERVWQRFHQAAGVAPHDGTSSGLGLGLHISRTIVEWHGGEAGLISAPGAGSTFWFTLPLARD